MTIRRTLLPAAVVLFAALLFTLLAPALAARAESPSATASCTPRAASTAAPEGAGTPVPGETGTPTPTPPEPTGAPEPTPSASAEPCGEQTTPAVREYAAWPGIVLGILVLASIATAIVVRIVRGRNHKAALRRLAKRP